MADAQAWPGSAHPLPQAWLTEVHEYAQRDVVIMLLGNKVSGFLVRVRSPAPPFPLPQNEFHPASSLPRNVSWTSFQQRTLSSLQFRG